MSAFLQPNDYTAQIRRRLAAVESQIPILRPGEFCDSATFLDNLGTAIVDIIAKIAASEPSPFQAGYCSQKSETELLRAVHTGSSLTLESAIALGSVAIKFAQADDPNRGIIISMFGRALNERWKVSKADKDLDDAIYYFQNTIEFEPADEPNRALHFDDLGCALWERYTRAHREDDFEASKAAFEAAADLPHSGKPMFLSNLGRLYKDKALAVPEERKPLLQHSLTAHLHAISYITPEFRASIRSLYRNLATTYLELYPIDGDDPVASIDSSVKERVQASSNRWMFLYEIGVVFSDKFFASGNQEDASQAVAILKSALDDSPENRTILATLANTLEQQGVSLQSQQVFAEAYRFSEKAMTLTNGESPDILSRWLSASSIATRLFELTNDLKYIENAISVVRRALASPVLGGVKRWKFQQLLGVQLSYRFKVSEKPRDLDEAVLSLKAAVDTTAEGLTDADKADNLREYGKALFARFQVSKRPDDFDSAVEALKKAVILFGPDKMTVVDASNDLANAMTIQFDKTGKLKDINKAIDYYLQALAALERFPMIEVRKPVYYMGLGNAFFTKYEMWEQMTDLNQAIAYYEAAVKASDPSDVRFGGRIGSLSRAQLQKCRSTHDGRLLLILQGNIKSFLARMPSPSSHEIAFLQNILGASYLHEYDESDNEVAFFDKAAESFQAALDAGSAHPLDVNFPLINLTRALTGKYSKTRTSEQLLKIQGHFRNPNSRELRSLLDTLGQFSALVYDTKNQLQFGRLAAKYYLTIASDPTAFSERRLWASLQASRLIYEVNHAPADARNVLVQVVKLLPEAILMGPNRADQLRAAKGLAPLPSLIISFSLAAGDTLEDALLLYEQSRSFIWNRLLDMKTDLSALHDKHKDLADRFEHLRLVLNRVSPQAVVTEESAIFRVRQHDLSNEYNEILRLIRLKEGFERFLLLDEPSHILDTASQGPVVILNATKYRGDAILISSEGISSIMLPHFFSDACVENAILSSDPQRASSLFELTLKWLWEAAASPVLEKLGLNGLASKPDQKLPRIWWLVSGWISFLPIHAAGDHMRAMKTREPCTVMDRVISSYTPTLRALEYARKSAKDMSLAEKSHPSTAVLISMPTTPDDQDLTNVSKEVASVEEIIHTFFQVTSLEHPRRQDVIPLLKQVSVAHFACHGVADSSDPSLSKLKLQDWKRNPLDVRFLLRNSFDRLRLVYLSAYETALNKVTQLREESIHPSAAFQMAGVPYAVASMWNVEDNASVQIASDFYFRLAVGTEFNLEKSAEALHYATMKARNAGMDATFWGAFIHSGA
ncbi:CHAT domain-containing protein [Gymnopilus junonius]|uniref:CHAT domain-containing protein n=1 Tax=Gymnopilus junonius TaxID=109634 RepID=A0A9P5NKY4_GYMJU|nr:CHAT domain-containing protein [Gymnopilus junonius]